MMALSYRTSDITPARLDPWHYQPRFVAALHDLSASGLCRALGEIIDQDRGLKSGATPLGAEYPEAGPVRFYRTADVRDLMVHREGAAFISAAQDAELTRSRLQAGDVLLTITGVHFGQSGVVSDAHVPGNISQHSVRFSLQSGYDPHFVVAFLSTRQGQDMVWRQAYGATRPAIDFPGVAAVLVRTPSPDAQRYIGEKVRDAERLTGRARDLRRRVTAYFDELLSIVPVSDPSKKHARVSSRRLSNRINAEYYAERFTSIEMALEQKFKNSISILNIAPTVRVKAHPAQPCQYREISDLDALTGTFLAGTFYEAVADIPNNAQRTFDRGDVAVSTRRPNRGAVAVVDEQCESDFYSIFLARLKPKTLDLAYWLKEYLRHDVGRRLLEQRCTWTTYPVISEDDLETVPVPDDPTGWAQIGSWARDASSLQRSAQLLAEAAKLLVEQLVEGRISESDLVDAQAGIEAGNRSGDRVLLGGLRRRDGADSAPLLPDLDALYALLDNEESVGGSE